MTDLDDGTGEPLILAELLNHVLDKGVVLTGDVVISVADVDLIRLGLSVYLSAIERRGSLDPELEAPGQRLQTPKTDQEA